MSEARHRVGPDRWGIVSLAAIGAALLAGCVLLWASSARFGPTIEVRDMPAAELALGLALAGALWMLLLPLLRLIVARGTGNFGQSRSALIFVLAAGLAMRLVLFTSTPALEDDYFRYLWEGGLVAHGISPYAVSPEDAREEDEAGTALARLATAAGPVLDRVNHSHLRTIYPPVAEASFALAHLIAPWSLAGWRTVVLAADAGTALVILALLSQLGRSPLWVTLYWWNPIVLKELMNSAHMEAVLMLFVMGSLLLLVRGRTMAALLVLGLAIGTKVWPLLLVPLYSRALWPDWRRLAVAALLLGGMGAALAAPILHGGLDETSGFVAFAGSWQTNSALLPGLRGLIALVPGLGAGDGDLSGKLARLLMALAAGCAALLLAWRAHGDADDIVRRAGATVTAIVLASPAQFPWYMVWMIAFIPLLPRASLAIVSVTTPLYYLLFHYSARGSYDAMFLGRIVWVIWLPVWALLGIEAWRAMRLRGEANDGEARA